jgi:DNA-binding NtrC family response regulator
MPQILFIEKGDRGRALLQCRLTNDYRVKSAPSIEAAWKKLSSRKFDLILWNTTCDSAAELNLGETLKLLSSKVSGSPIVVFGNPRTFDASPSCGGNVHIENLPTNEEDLLALVESNFPVKGPGDPGNCKADNPGVPINFEGIIAVSLPMRAIMRRAMDAAAVDIPVLITGETGTGKDLVAAAIHRRSSRNNNPYIPVNMGAMARELIASEIFGHERGAYTGAQETRPGIFEQADGGTVFLDEVATMDEKTQVSLLRV